MTALEDAHSGANAPRPLWRRAFGSTLFVMGSIGILLGVIIGGTKSILIWDVSYVIALELSAILGGLGVLSVIAGGFVLVPGDNGRERILGTGSVLATIAIVGFVLAYPANWYGNTPDYTLYIVGLYTLGGLTCLYAVFDSIATFKVRNAPGGTVTLELFGGDSIEEEQENRTYGSVGIIGQQEVENVPTQTRNDAHVSGDQTDAVVVNDDD